MKTLRVKINSSLYNWYEPLKGKTIKVFDVNEAQYAPVAKPDLRIWKSDCEEVDSIRVVDVLKYLAIAFSIGMAIMGLFEIYKRF